MIYPKTVEVMEKIPNLDKDDYVYSMRDIGTTKRVIGNYSSLEEVIKNKAFKEYSEVVFSVRKPGVYREYRCLFSSKEKAEKAHKEITKLWRTNQERLMKKNS